MMLAAVRVRGVKDVDRTIRETLDSLRLDNQNNCILIEDADIERGMLQRAKDYIAYGEIDTETVATLLAKRGRVTGGDLENALEELGYDDTNAVAEALANGELSPKDLRQAGMKTPFRLSPPSKGYRGTKQHYNQGGSLGHRDDMDTLLKRMM